MEAVVVPLEMSRTKTFFEASYNRIEALSEPIDLDTLNSNPLPKRKDLETGRSPT